MYRFSKNISIHRTFRNNSERIEEYFAVDMVKTVEKRELYRDHPAHTAEITNGKQWH
jgi:hypothetical protein